MYMAPRWLMPMPWPYRLASKTKLEPLLDTLQSSLSKD